MAFAAMIFLLRLGHIYIMKISLHGKAVGITGPFSGEYNSDRLIPLFPVTGGFPSRGNSYDSFNVCISMSAWTSCWIKRRVSGVSRLHDAHLPHCNINNGAGLHRMTPYIRIYTYIHTYISYVYIFRNYTRQYTCNYRYICILHHWKINKRLCVYDIYPSPHLAHSLPRRYVYQQFCRHNLGTLWLSSALLLHPPLLSLYRNVSGHVSILLPVLGVLWHQGRYSLS